MASGIRTPVEVGLPSSESYGDTYEETRSRTEMDTGSPRMRNKMRTAPRLFDVSWKLTQADYQAFDSWFQDTIKGGLMEFDIQLLDDTEDLVWYTARFVDGTYTATIDAWDNWIVSGTVRALGDPFEVRVPATDEIEGRVAFRMTNTGAMVVGKALFGRSSLGLTSARGAFRPPVIYGRGTMKINYGKGNLQTREPWYGRASISLTGTKGYLP